jgi:hypothetical protein
MVKKNTSYRLNEEQIAQLDRLVDYYKGEMMGATSMNFNLTVSKATVLELLIKERYDELVKQNLIKEV